MTLEEVNKIAALQLTSEEITILKLRTGMKPPEVAKRLGTSRQNVYKLEKQANRKMEEQKRQ
jgi:transcriptional regulator